MDIGQNLFFVFIEPDIVEVYKHTKNRPVLSHLDPTCFHVKKNHLFYGKSTLFSRGTLRVISSGQDSVILPAQVSQSQCRIRFIMPAYGATTLDKINGTSGPPLPFYFKDTKMARFCSFAPSSLLWGGEGEGS